MANDEFIETNRLNWDDRAGLHAHPTTGYRLDRFRNDRSLLSDVIDFDKTYLGALSGLHVVHLQCHIGTDTLSLARLGANVTGLDQSGASLDGARDLFASVDTPGRFVQANVYDAVDALDEEQFDLVYTGVGALNWLPDIARWGETVAALVRPGGSFYIREGHPVAWAIDLDRTDGALQLKYPYFETVEPMTFDQADTYVDTAGAKVSNTRFHEWNHGIGEIFMALTNAGLSVNTIDEHKALEWEMLPQQYEVDQRWYLPDDQINLLPVMYSMAATKPA
jgi:SAM-dependent methyltransferase